MKCFKEQPGPLTDQRIERIPVVDHPTSPPHWGKRDRWETARPGRRGAIMAPEMASFTKL